MTNTVHLIDCMEFMKDIPDKYYELAIVDPPYGLDKKLSVGAGKLKNRAFRAMYKNSSQWDIKPNDLYFTELFRISQNQIIWGGNYFNLPPTRGIICWDKVQPWDNFSQWELGWTSFDVSASLFKYDNRTGDKIHPTQKPVALYKWLLQNYAKPHDKIFDSHVGSGSSRIACYDLGFDFEGCELDADYWQAQEARYQNHISQQSLFDAKEIQELIYK